MHEFVWEWRSRRSISFTSSQVKHLQHKLRDQRTEHDCCYAFDHWHQERVIKIMKPIAATPGQRQVIDGRHYGAVSGAAPMIQPLAVVRLMPRPKCLHYFVVRMDFWLWWWKACIYFQSLWERCSKEHVFIQLDLLEKSGRHDTTWDDSVGRLWWDNLVYGQRTPVTKILMWMKKDSWAVASWFVDWGSINMLGWWCVSVFIYMI